MPRARASRTVKTPGRSEGSGSAWRDIHQRMLTRERPPAGFHNRPPDGADSDAWGGEDVAAPRRHVPKTPGMQASIRWIVGHEGGKSGHGANPTECRARPSAG